MEVGTKNKRANSGHGVLWAAVLGFLVWSLAPVSPAEAKAEPLNPAHLRELITNLASFGDRSTGTSGNRAAAEFIKNSLSALGLDPVGSHRFSVPVMRHEGSSLVLPGRNLSLDIKPIRANAITPETIPPQGLDGPLVYVGAGELRNFNGKEIAGSIILMEMDSGKNWLNAANLGAKALIYVDRGPTAKMFFEEKTEFSPIQFPRFWLPLARAREFFGGFETAPGGLAAPQARLFSQVTWEVASGENIYCLIPGADAKLKKELVMVEAFYDSTALVFGIAPGADEALSVAALLELARALKLNPPVRSVLIVATTGHAQALAGMREMIWSLRARPKDLTDMGKRLEATVKNTKKILGALDRVPLAEAPYAEAEDQDINRLLEGALKDRIKLEADAISRQLAQLRMLEAEDDRRQMIQELASRRNLLNRLNWRSTFKNLSPEEGHILNRLIPSVITDQQTIFAEAENQLKQLKSANSFRSSVKDMKLIVAVSLHLSSHGGGVGAFNQGGLYPLKPTVNRQDAYYTLDEVLNKGALDVQKALGLPSLFHDTLHAGRLRPWQSYFPDQPFLGGEVSALAGYLGVSLATIHDARSLWGTPYDLPADVNWDQAMKQSALVCGLLQSLVQARRLHSGRFPANGFATVTGRANFLRHGELFADQPAPGSVIMAYQGTSRYYAMVDSMGIFSIKGVGDRRHLLDKVIMEGYRFDRDTGDVEWAIDKKQTHKDAYRLNVRRNAMKTDLVMFACKQSTIFNLLEPRNFRYLTKIQLLDGRREALPLHYWYSRLDTRASSIASVYLEPGTRFKMTLSDTILRKKMILTNATTAQPEGTGYLVDDWPFLHRGELNAARDIMALLGPRIASLEGHGIVNEKIREHHRRGMAALKEAEQALKEKRFDAFSEAGRRSWALASRVYEDVEKTKKDVLLGVLFYIALFIPFAFCLERLLFCYSDIYKRIIAFCGILILLVAVIYNIHPAFQLAYSPIVVILAFFIMGLSLLVTLIIFSRFEEEMARLQRQAQHMKGTEISPWKAFIASFFLGVTNLRRRRIRTALTCITLIILTFTIMSFTSVKTIRHHARLLYQKSAPYQGFLMKNVNWRDLPTEALGTLANAFEGKGEVTPRVWLEVEDRTRTIQIPLRYKDRLQEAQGLVGLGAKEAHVSGIDKILVSGRWLNEEDRYAVLLPERMASYLGIDFKDPKNAVVLLWGMPFNVVGTFSGEKLQGHLDLDGESLTPVTFPSEDAMEMTEVEMDAAESGEDIQAFHGRYQHVPGDLTVIMPYRTLLAAGGRLKSVAVRLVSLTDNQSAAYDLTDRFGLSLFSGEPAGTFLYNVSDAISYSGVPNIVIPLLISIFIVLNTMIGSVYERKREIGIYTSIGLAPSHVSFLFITEAIAFAVLSVVAGYLLAQTSASFFAGTSLWAGITVNYSSLAGVGAMFLVILVVLVSVIYPSRVAAQIAIPDVNRSWKLPLAEGNLLEATLPFLMKYREFRSTGGYLYEYFQGHQDVTHGVFSTGHVDFAFICPTQHAKTHDASACTDGQCCRETCLQLSAQVWLAPFDFGIMQQVEVHFCPAKEEPGFLEIKIIMKRQAGEANAWRRVNKGFIDAVRKQLLLWRSLDETAHAHYEGLLVLAQEEKDACREAVPDAGQDK